MRLVICLNCQGTEMILELDDSSKPTMDLVSVPVFYMHILITTATQGEYGWCHCIHEEPEVKRR